ncbi:ATP synthase F1 [Colletotrichum abscissum]|uniref:Serine protease n=1 Tax=Colletotrichum abscissum TaxID=1671311 RepID=A0A9P9X0E6_9PEZI|nr:ATP synthase F1 [Colletotrichum abscissum]KAI3529394.1 ATP synthase F1 [Colletotrichum abscissum]KAK1472858.1 ATP synthase F1 [Colletotrichum abscissum]
MAHHLLSRAAIWTLQSSTPELPADSAILPDDGTIGMESVFGKDKRRLVEPQDFADGGKFRSIVKIQARFNSGNDQTIWMMGTGWLVSPDTVVTAGHVVYDWRNRWQAAIEVKCFIGYSGLSSVGTSKVQGRFGEHVVTTAHWVNGNNKRAHDVAFLKLNRPFTGNLRTIPFQNTPTNGIGLRLGVVGYPGDKHSQHPSGDDDEEGAQMYEEFTRVNYSIQDSQSGAPILQATNDGGFVSIGTHCYGGGHAQKNSGTSIGGDYGINYVAFISLFDSGHFPYPHRFGIKFVNVNPAARTRKLQVHSVRRGAIDAIHNCHGIGFGTSDGAKKNGRNVSEPNVDKSRIKLHIRENEYDQHFNHCNSGVAGYKDDHREDTCTMDDANCHNGGCNDQGYGESHGRNDDHSLGINYGGNFNAYHGNSGSNYGGNFIAYHSNPGSNYRDNLNNYNGMDHNSLSSGLETNGPLQRDGEGVCDVLRLFSDSAERPLWDGPPLLGPLGGVVGIVAGSILSAVGGVEFCSMVDGPFQAVESAINAGAIERAVLAEAALQALLKLEYSTEVADIFDIIDIKYRALSPQLSSLAKTMMELSKSKLDSLKVLVQENNERDMDVLDVIQYSIHRIAPPTMQFAKKTVRTVVSVVFNAAWKDQNALRLKKARSCLENSLNHPNTNDQSADDGDPFGSSRLSFIKQQVLSDQSITGNKPTRRRQSMSSSRPTRSNQSTTNDQIHTSTQPTNHSQPVGTNQLFRRKRSMSSSQPTRNSWSTTNNQLLPSTPPSTSVQPDASIPTATSVQPATSIEQSPMEERDMLADFGTSARVNTLRPKKSIGEILSSSPKGHAAAKVSTNIINCCDIDPDAPGSALGDVEDRKKSGESERIRQRKSFDSNVDFSFDLASMEDESF